jgi:hypothetical protein
MTRLTFYRACALHIFIAEYSLTHPCVSRSSSCHRTQEGQAQAEWDRDREMKAEVKCLHKLEQIAVVVSVDLFTPTKKKEGAQGPIGGGSNCPLI